MLDFLVTSKARRRLLQALWREDAIGSTARLAALASVGFASAYRELKRMEARGLVVAERQGAARVYRANRTHPLAEAFGAVVTAAAPAPTEDAEVQRVRAQLAALGAPVQHEAVEPSDSAAPVEATVARGVHVAHRDPDVARTLPVCLYLQRDKLEPAKLLAHAKQLGERHALGFFLELTTELSGDRRFAAWARALRDHRRTARHAFFSAASRSRRELRLADERTPAAARRWGWRMNMDLDAFRSTFDKFGPHAAA